MVVWAIWGALAGVAAAGLLIGLVAWGRERRRSAKGKPYRIYPPSP